MAGNGFDNGERRLTFLPMLSVDFASRATLTVDTEFYDQRGRNYRHAVPATAEAQRGDFSGVLWDLGAAAPDDGWTGRNIAPGVRLDVGLGSNSSLHVAGRFTKIDGDIDVQALLAASADGQRLDRFQYREISEWQEYQSDSFATFTARTGRIGHRLVTGFEAGVSTTDTRFGVGAAPLSISPTPSKSPRCPSRT
jgi:outer membrane receptor protein involved in Fe transport